MTAEGLQTAIAIAAKARNAAIAKASKEAPDYAAYDAATSQALHAYQRTVKRAYARLTF